MSKKETGNNAESHLLGKMNQGHYKAQPQKTSANESLAGEKAHLQWSAGEKISSRKSQKSHYLPRNAENRHPQEKISRPQNRVKPPRSHKKK